MDSENHLKSKIFLIKNVKLNQISGYNIVTTPKKIEELPNFIPVKNL